MGRVWTHSKGRERSELSRFWGLGGGGQARGRPGFEVNVDAEEAELSDQVGSAGAADPKAWHPDRMSWPGAFWVLRRDHMGEWELIWP